MWSYLLLNGYRVLVNGELFYWVQISFWEDEKIMEMGSDDGCIPI